MSTPQPDGDMSRGKGQVDHELVLGEVSDVLLTLEHSLNRAKRALRVTQKSGQEPNIELALGEVISSMDAARKRLLKDAYYAGDALRML